MTKIILAGTVGHYKTKHPETFGDTSFIVTYDTLVSSEKLPVRFKGGAEGCWIFMYDASFDPPTDPIV